MRRPAVHLLHLLIIALVLLSASAARGVPATSPAREKPHNRVGQSGCVKTECHASIRNYPIVHGPVNVNACDACHELTDPESHTFRLTRDKAELCTYCHEFDVSAMPVVHKPVKEGQCLGCHDPHGGSSKSFIRERSVEDLCNRCHEKITTGKTVLHTPVKQGACDSCHPPHASRFKNLLDVAGPDLCLTCHEEFEASMARAKFTHKALEKGCEKCHDVHGSRYVNATTQPIVEQCAGCHEKVTADATAARYPHTPVMSDRACGACHTPHGGSLAKLVLDSPDKLCMSCHDKEQKTNRGYVVPAVAELMDVKSTTKHGGIKDGTCSGCHAAHGSNQQLFLTKYYTKAFYQKFSPSQYELCFSCHDLKLVQETMTTKLTNFRNGERNLHALHVRDTKERGENCRVCHNTHAGENARIVRDAITYGTWTMPVRYAKTDTGGSCFPGCHPLYRYDRNNPVKNTPGVPTTQPAIASAVGERPSAITMELHDVTGQTVRIPDARNTTILALVHTDELKQTTKALDSIAAVNDIQDARIVVIVSGPTATRDAASLASSRKLSAVADPDASMASELDVHGFPTTLVLRPDGLEIARISGAVETLSIKLATYLQLASGELDEKSATTRLATPDLIADSKLARDLRQIDRLSASGKPDQALQLLMKLPEGSIPNWRHNLLGAKTLMTLNRWPEAKEAALAATSQNPASDEAHFVLAQIYEHDGDWKAAAAEYRAAAQK